MKVKAIQPGYYGGQYRYPGDEFEVKSGSKAAWFAPADNAPDVKTKGRSSSSEKPSGPDNAPVSQ